MACFFGNSRPYSPIPNTKYGLYTPTPLPPLSDIMGPVNSKTPPNQGLLFRRISQGPRLPWPPSGLSGLYWRLQRARRQGRLPLLHPRPLPLLLRCHLRLRSSLADLAVLPVESTMGGSALRNYSLLLRHDLRIVQELNLFVHYCLLAMPGVRQAQLPTVISHPIALAHCGRALTRLGLHPEAVEDTAGAVQMLRSGQLLDTAAIASPRAATIYGLDVLAHGIQDEGRNVTRFLLLSQLEAIMSDVTTTWNGKKTSIVVAHRGGSMTVLFKVLSAFSLKNVNLTKLETNNPLADGERPPVMVFDVRGRGLTKSFSHVLYVDFEGSVEEDENVKDAIDEISKFSVFVRILGCYAADHPNVYNLH